MTGNYASHRRCDFIFLMVDSVFSIYCFQLTSTMLSKYKRRITCQPFQCSMLTYKSMLMYVLYSVFYMQGNYHDSENSSPTLKPKSANIFILFFKNCLLTDTSSSKKRVYYTKKKKNSIYSTFPITFCIKLFSFSCMLCLSGSVSRWGRHSHDSLACLTVCRAAP